MVETLRFKASRPVYRRGGLVLGSAAWTLADVAELGAERLGQLIADPLVQVEGQLEEGQWVRMPREIRSEMAFRLAHGDPDAREDTPPVMPEAENGPGAGREEVAAGSGEPSQDGGEPAPSPGPAGDPPAGNDPAPAPPPAAESEAKPAATAPAKPAAEPKPKAPKAKKPPKAEGGKSGEGAPTGA